MNQSLLGVHLRLLGMACLWGASWPWGRMAAQVIPPITASAIRFSIASIALLIWLYYADNFKTARSLTSKQWLGLLATGFTGIFAYSACFLTALQWTPSGKASAVIALNPAITLVFAALLFKEKLNKSILLGIGLAVFGSLFAISQGHPLAFFSGSVGLGEYLLLGCVLAWGGYTLLGRVLLKGIDALTATTFASVLGAILLLIAGGLTEGIQAWEAALHSTWSVKFALIMMALGSTTLAYSWYFDGVKALGAGNASAYIALVPVFGISISAIFLNEPLHHSLLIGAPLAILGMVIMHWGQSH
ncbi:DMT family transporter [Pelistega europaea]|uniref:DMT family transporter n=1 Tax=Pelistega europaea TaxID=106147 RepID=A0A7Y4P559_9BURK|nr:DMT family transporter [Pelistega europaea]NOL49438.1 DMT family transporter [Pelistega europaea]